MNESFKKFFRNPEDDLKIRNQAGFEKEELEEIRNDFVNEIITRFKQLEKSSLSIEEELGEGIKERILFLLDVSTEYFASLGYPNVKFNPFFLTSGNLHAEAGSSSRMDGVTVENTNIDHKELKQLAFLKLLGHELYHSTAAVSLTVTDSYPSPNHLHRHINGEEGASYRQGDEEKINALEEGLASRFELLMFEKIKTLFPRELVEYYDDLTTQIVSRGYHTESDSIDIALHSYDSDTGYVTFGTSGYKPPRELVYFLASRINNFDMLVEQARLKRYPLALARAIEFEFGDGAYRRITTARNEESYALIEELSSK
jgi:hypothetical protein